jgi:polysaccharide biosynthesis protein PelA
MSARSISSMIRTFLRTPTRERQRSGSIFDRRPSSWDRRAFLAAVAGPLLAATAKADVSRTAPVPNAGKPIRWVAFYGANADEFDLATYDLVVLDAGYEGSISLVAEGGAKVCAYLSAGEIRETDPYLQYVDPDALLPENPNWPGTRRVDVRHPSWRSLILDREIPAIVAQGFTGLMLDNLDTPPYLETSDPARYRGMREAAVGLVASIRAQWPDMTIVMNRGYAMLPQLVEKIDAVIAESLLTSADPKTGECAWLDAGKIKAQLDLMRPATRRRPPMPILSLDYWDPSDRSTVAEIYRRERALGHHPYVSTLLLDRIIAEED